MAGAHEPVIPLVDVVGKAAMTSGIAGPDCGGPRVEGGRIYLGWKGAHTAGSVVHEQCSLKLKAVFVWHLPRLQGSNGALVVDARIFPAQSSNAAVCLTV